MSNSKSGTQPETSAERAVADLAAAKFKDYQQRWAPRQAALAKTIAAMGKAGSTERTQLKAAGAADTGVKFDEAEKGLAARDVAMGNNRASSAFKLHQAGLDADKAASIGIGSTVADQMVDDAYISGMQSLMQIGRGQEATAAKGIGQSAQIQAGIAANDAELAANARAGNASAVGTFAGMGVGAGSRYMRNNRGAGEGGVNLFAGDQPGRYSNVGGIPMGA